MQEQGNQLYQLRAFLWGIETTETRQGTQTLQLGCEPSYEELKQIAVWIGGLFRSVASLPMRNWNALQSVASSKKPGLLRAFLWGIETNIYIFRSFITTTRCEPSYEELKLRVDSEKACGFLELRAFLWGIETSSQNSRCKDGLFVASLPMRNWNKLRYAYCVFLFNVASLPMRNWNNAFNPPKAYIIIVASLPMRNWNTNRPIKAVKIDAMLRAFLWGIETWFRFLPPVLPLPVASLPMRNWNQ